ncbi:MAG: PAS domain S-box protein [Bacteroidales bacterium]|nr:PAS domain S-box protein [Bacteroidales bacterium]
MSTSKRRENIVSVNVPQREIDAASSCCDSNMIMCSLVSQSGVSLFIHDFNGNIIQVNQHACDSLGYSREELIKMNIADIELDFDLESAQREWSKICTKFRYTLYGTQRRKDGTTFPVEVILNSSEWGDEKLFLCIVNDLSERLEAETLLKASEERYRTLIENMNEGVLMTDNEDVILFANKRICEIYGYSQDELIGKIGYKILEHPDSAQIVASKKDFRLDGLSDSYEVIGVKKSGELINIAINGAPIRNNSGEVTGTVGIIRDITREREIIKDLISAKERAEQSDKLKSAFINNISHEIRTPMIGILGFGQFLTDPTLSESERIKYFNNVQASSQRLIQTVNDYMDIAMIVSGTVEINPQKLFIKTLVDKLAERCHSECRDKGLDFELVLPVNTSTDIIFSDEELLSKAIQKLIDNALKFTKKGKITFGYETNFGEVSFFVKDTGVGIAKDKLDAIFEVFTQEDTTITRGFEGSGLGLAIAKGLSLILNGTISVSSAKEGGSVFSVSIPYNGANLAIQSKLPLQEKDKNPERPLVLVAEDDETNSAYLEVVLKKAGCNTVRAENGREAVDICRKNPDISLVLMDIKMPVFSGLDATREIRKFRPVLPIVATSSFAQPGDEFHIMSAGCTEYFPKPVKPETLYRLVLKYTRK